MALLFVHGVNTRSESPPADVLAYVERYLTGRHFPTGPTVVYSYWGDLGGRYRFGGRSRPRTRIAGQGAGGDDALIVSAEFPDLPALDTVGGSGNRGARSSIAGGMSAGGAGGGGGERLSEADRGEAVAFLMRTAERTLADDDEMRWAALAALSELADDDAVWGRIRQADSAEAELAIVADYLDDHTPDPTYAEQGTGWLSRFTDNVGEGLRRAAGAPALALSTGLGELRPKVDDLLEQFVGDIFAYLDGRQPEPEQPDPPPDFDGPPCLWAALTAVAGPIPRRVVLDLLRCAEIGGPGEPLVVLSHSMGGQIMYEVFATFLPRLRSELDKAGCDVALPKVDLWCASASQVGLFEELSAFLGSDEASRVGAPFPGTYLRHWWNVWDRSDLLSFTAEGIVDGVDDGEYSSGRGFFGAHSGYLERPSFFKKLAAKLDEVMNEPGG